jgi:uncharacterized repeat protein (TIGR03803 family)
MKNRFAHCTSTVGKCLGQACFAVALLGGLMLATLPAAHAQTFTLLHAFTNGEDGGTPIAGVTVDGGGNIYGTASTGGSGNGGTAYQLKHAGDGWTLNTIHAFDPGSGDGGQPMGRPVIGPGGALYGTTSGGGGTDCTNGCGTVYSLRPPGSFCRSGVCAWTETVIHKFEGYPNDGGQPEYVDPIFDPAGNMYVTTCGGGGVNYGGVWEFTPGGSGWTESRVHVFIGGDGECPQSNVYMDQAGKLYGTTLQGTGNQGEVYQLALSGSNWMLNRLVVFEEGLNGNAPSGGLIADPAGNLYGMTDSGTVYELSYSGGTWNFTELYQLPGSGGYGALARDASGNLYGTQFVGGQYGVGAVFKLALSNGSWTYIDLHDFTIANGGAFPYGGVTLDAQGNLYGTASQGGVLAQGCGYWGCGSVWKIQP